MNKQTLLDGLRNFLWGEDTGVEVNDYPDNDPEGVEVEKAANPSHTHDHAHLSSYGYSYTHNHPHTHRDGVTPNSDDHNSSETAHAHQHVSKAGESVTQEQLDGMLADLKGLSETLGQLKAAKEAQDKELEGLKAEMTEVTKARDEAVEKAKSLEAERASVTDATVQKTVDADAKIEELTNLLKQAGRAPLVAAPADVKKAVADTKKMKFDDAFDAVMGRETPLPKA